jgi:hypothetical protein
MGEKNSSFTRVQPVFDALLDKDPTGGKWLQRLCEMAASTRPEAQFPSSCGKLIAAETPARGARVGKVFERIVAPPTAFLRWLLEHPKQMDVRNLETFGTAEGSSAREWRRKLFSSDQALRQEAINEGVRQLEAKGARGSGRRWWAFEGFSHIDCCLITDSLVLFVEGERTEAVSPSTLWFKQRSQIWRNVEAAREYAAGREFVVLLAVEGAGEGESALEAAASGLAGSYPHLSKEEAADLARHLLGYVTWRGIVEEFGLPESCLIERTSNSPADRVRSP